MSIIVVAVGDGWPVVDIDLREGRGASVSFHRLTQSEPRDTVRRTDCLDLPTSHRNFEPV